ncbi:hypothetical protein G6F57_016053 [Rhizopus arrhizus]|nr:hypothetical protein G6F57_016053 [Rhizopus arrhizus]
MHTNSIRIGASRSASSASQRPSWRSSGEHRAQGQHGPVDQEAGQLGPGRTDPPDLVEGLFNTVEGDQQRHHQRDETGRGQLAGTGRELAQVALGRTRGIGGRRQGRPRARRTPRSPAAPARTPWCTPAPPLPGTGGRRGSDATGSGRN